mmetsp:Transcript_544/g.714  ORF Transcript_544/g.714 Transcript_544/m.714 type:complete len:147 (-) Transcript_544:805-1245(-)
MQSLTLAIVRTRLDLLLRGLKRTFLGVFRDYADQLRDLLLLAVLLLRSCSCIESSLCLFSGAPRSLSLALTRVNLDFEDARELPVDETVPLEHLASVLVHIAHVLLLELQVANILLALQPKVTRLSHEHCAHFIDHKALLWSQQGE